MYGQDHNEIIARLASLFPKAFFENPKQRVPLKPNIVADVENQGCCDLIGADVGAGIDFYMTHVGYQICLSTPGTVRVDLEGNPVSRVTEQEAITARKRAAEANQIIREKRASYNHVRPIVNRDTDDQIDKVAAVRKAAAAADQKRSTLSSAELVVSANRKLARASSLLESDDDEFKAMFIEKVLKEAKADIEAVLAKLSL
jgi:sRNA-binding protein